MRILVLGTMLLVLASACSPIRTVTPIPPNPASTVAGPAAAGPTVGAQGAVSATQTPQGATAAPPPANAGPVALQVLSPADGSVVNTQLMTVTGATSPGAVVTVNDDILVAGGGGQFQDNVSLAEGPNVIEIIASNSSGSEASLELTVIYQP
jgi:glucodextranase-like protein